LTALAINVGSAGAFVTFNGALGTPSSGTLTSATGLPISTGLTGAGTGILTALGVNVGTAGSVVVNGGVLGTPSSGVATNLTGTASGLTAGNVTTNANLTGDVTSVGNASTVANIPVGATFAGANAHTNVAAPSSPAAGKVSVYTDSTDLRLHDKNASGVIGTTVVADTGASNNFLTAISAAGAISKAQPAFTNLSGSVAASQMPALTGDVTTSAGAVATTIAANAVTNAKAAQMAAYTIKGNSTGSTANATDISIPALTQKVSPVAGDILLLVDSAASNALKYATVSSVASAGSVSSIAGNTGAFTLGTGLTNSVNDIRLSYAAASTTTTTATPNTGSFSGGSTATWRYWNFGKIVYFTVTVTPTYAAAGGYITIPLPVGTAAADYTQAGFNATQAFMTGGFIQSGTTAMNIFKYDGTYPQSASGQKIVISGFYEIT
jgi:hypothetical protein